MNLVRKAALFAIEAHGNQLRKYTHEPYWKHLAEVAAIYRAGAENVTEEAQAACWLHDTLEDTEVGIDYIDEEFGRQVANLVWELTAHSEIFEIEGNRAERKYWDAKKLSHASSEAQTIKCADLISNTSSIVTHDEKFAKVYLKEKEHLLRVMQKAEPFLHHWAVSELVKAKEKLEKNDVATNRNSA